jgi:hypothetical protein
MSNSVTCNHRHEKRGRRPINQRAMTPAERQQRRRDKFKAALPAHHSEERFRLELWQWMQRQNFFYGELDTRLIGLALEQLSTALRMDAYMIAAGRADEANWFADYLTRRGLFSPGRYLVGNSNEV